MPRTKIIDLTEDPPMPHPTKRSRNSENPSTIVEATKNILLEAISNAHHHRLEKVLKNIIDEHGQLAIDWLAKEFLVSQSAVKQPTDGNVASGDDTKDGGNKRRKRNSDKLLHGGSKSSLAASELSPSAAQLRPRYATCEHCEEEFNVTKNSSDACGYHPSEMERVHECFDDCCDWDSEFDREDNPGGYMYLCCDRMGDEPGCKVCPHREK